MIDVIKIACAVAREVLSVVIRVALIAAVFWLMYLSWRVAGNIDMLVGLANTSVHTIGTMSEAQNGMIGRVNAALATAQNTEEQIHEALVSWHYKKKKRRIAWIVTPRRVR